MATVPWTPRQAHTSIQFRPTIINLLLLQVYLLYLASSPSIHLNLPSHQASKTTAMSSPERQRCRDKAYGTYVDQDSENDWGSNSHSWRVSFPCGWRVSFKTAVHGGKPVDWPEEPFTRDGDWIEHMAFLMHFHAHGNRSTNYVCDICNDGIGYGLGRMMKHVKRFHNKAELLRFFGYARRSIRSECVIS